MKPICPTVEQPSRVFASICTDFRSLPTNALVVPTTTTTSMNAGSAVMTGAKRTSRTPPALTNPACISAEAGVGAFIDESNQVWKGTSAD